VGGKDPKASKGFFLSRKRLRTGSLGEREKDILLPGKQKIIRNEGTQWKNE